MMPALSHLVSLILLCMFFAPGRSEVVISKASTSMDGISLFCTLAIGKVVMRPRHFLPRNVSERIQIDL